MLAALARAAQRSWPRSAVGLALLVGAACSEPRPPAALDPCDGACAEGAYCDPTSARCLCEVGTLGDPYGVCLPHGDLCSEAEQRVHHSVCEHVIDDAETWTRLSIGHAKDAGVSRGAKYLLPAVATARLPTVFADTNWYRSHHCLMAQGFEPYFPQLSYQGYQQLVLGRDTRELYGGTVSELSVPDPRGIAYVFTVETFAREDELLSEAEIQAVYRQLQDRLGIGALAYTADGALHVEQAMSWDDPPFPVALVPAEVGPQYEAYTTGLAYGRVRSFTAAELEAAGVGAFGWQDILVLDRAPLVIEGVMAASITDARQDVLTHLNVLSSLRGTPNIKVDDALEVLAPYEGKLVRLEAVATDYSIREVSVDEAEAHWAQARPHAELGAPPDFEATALLGLDDVPVGTAVERTGAVSRFGAKVAGLAVLRTVVDHARVVDGFGIPMGAYRRFMEGNSWQAPVAGGTQVATYAETLALWLDDGQFRSDARLRAEWLERLRTEMIERGVVDPALLDDVRAHVVALTGSDRTMVRLRSSSNAEDSLAFNGAGLYTSASACAPDQASDAESACEPGRGPEPLDLALRTVWASLWSFGAYEERELYGLDHRQVGMGVLCNPRFDGERANGVAFTGNPIDLTDPRLTIDVQLGDVDVVGNDSGAVAELDRVLVEGGQVVSIDREVASSLVPPGQVVLDDDQLRELALLLDAVERAYPVDAAPPEGAEVMLDLEFKLTAAGALVLKQIRPFAARPYVAGQGSCR